MSGTLNANYVQADVGANLYFNTATASGPIIAPVPIYSGANAASPLGGATNPVSGAIQSANNYIQKYIYNTANGAFSSADFSAYPSNGSDANGWIDMGITSLAFNQPGYSVTGPNEGYIFMSAPGGSGTSGNLIFSTDSTGTKNSHQWYTGGFNKAKNAPAMTLDGATGNLLLANNLTFTGSSAGITFNNPSALTNSTLNDYEQGTYTPVIAFGGNSVGVTYSAQSANYTKIGNTVHVHGTVYLSSKGSSTGTASISLPFASKSGPPYDGPRSSGIAGYYANFTNLGGGDIRIWIDHTSTVAAFAISNNGATINDTYFQNNMYMYGFSIVYQANF
jgi:hypothetical protein